MVAGGDRHLEQAFTDANKARQEWLNNLSA
jgi:hypothetical protein